MLRPLPPRPLLSLLLLWLILCPLFLALPGMAAAQSSAQAEAPASTQISPQTSSAEMAEVERGGFVVSAPRSLMPLLERHLSVLRDQARSGDGIERRGLIRRTRREVESLLPTEGYFQAEVRIEREATPPVRIVIEPGERTHITSVEIEFTGALAESSKEREARREHLRAAWSLPAGEPFRQTAWDAAKSALLEDVAWREFAAARIEHSRAEIDTEQASASLLVRIDSGPPFTLGELVQSGVERYRADLIPRYARLRPGEPYDQGRLLDLQARLQNTPYFSSVIVDVPRDASLADGVPVRVQVTEAQSRRVGFGLGVSSNQGLRAESTYRDVNVRGRGWEVFTGMRLEQKQQSLFADLLLPPNFSGHRDSFGALLEQSDHAGLRIGTRALGASRSHSRGLRGGSLDTALSLQWRVELHRPDGAPTSTHRSLSLNQAWTWRKVDDMLDPRHGHILEVQLGGGAKALLSDQNFLRVQGRAVRYQPIGQRDVLILRAEAGRTFAPSRAGIPQSFLFRTGGAQSVRGYAYQGIGVQEGAAVVGGRYLAVASAEYVRWLSPQWGMAGFVDTGNASDETRGFHLKTGYGVGVRWKSPAGPLAVDLARAHEDGRLRLHFGVAVAF